ncbi:hypothetical protein LPJ61_004187 [Coemansia biformis]|uniref:Uncharacterized protein n=1 Tax=Coemansia biformis TaxID=1286918 RepID=A0A9W7Y9Z9_9FUNG|nr:hypothetical protein LPJ61_004187 [Coemansia biformis]
MDPTSPTNAIVARLETENDIDGSAESPMAWMSRELDLLLHPDKAIAGEHPLYSCAMLRYDVERSGVAHVISNFSEIFGHGRESCVKYIVVHMKWRPDTTTTTYDIYRNLAHAITSFTGEPGAVIDLPTPPRSLSENLAHAIETALVTMPNLQGILVSRPGNRRSQAPYVAPRRISYCAAPRATGDRSLPVSILQCDDAEVYDNIHRWPNCLPLGISALEYMGMRRAPYEALTQIWNDYHSRWGPCSHEHVGPPASHNRRHLFFSPGHAFVRGWGGLPREYDWCRLVLTHEIAPPPELAPLL